MGAADLDRRIEIFMHNFVKCVRVARVAGGVRSHTETGPAAGAWLAAGRAWWAAAASRSDGRPGAIRAHPTTQASAPCTPHTTPTPRRHRRTPHNTTQHSLPARRNVRITNAAALPPVRVCSWLRAPPPPTPRSWLQQLPDREYRSSRRAIVRELLAPYDSQVVRARARGRALGRLGRLAGGRVAGWRAGAGLGSWAGGPVNRAGSARGRAGMRIGAATASRV